MHQHLNQDYMYTLLNYTITTTNDFFVYPSSCDRSHRCGDPASRLLTLHVPFPRQSEPQTKRRSIRSCETPCEPPTSAWGPCDLAKSHLDDVQSFRNDALRRAFDLAKDSSRFGRFWLTLASFFSWACGRIIDRATEPRHGVDLFSVERKQVAVVQGVEAMEGLKI